MSRKIHNVVGVRIPADSPYVTVIGSTHSDEHSRYPDMIAARAAARRFRAATAGMGGADAYRAAPEYHPGVTVTQTAWRIVDETPAAETH